MTTNNELNTKTEATESTQSHDQQPSEPQPAQAVEPGTNDPETVDDTQETADDGEHTKNAGKASREAQKYRHQLREVQAERDALQTKVDNFATTMVDHQLQRLVTLDRPAGPGNASVKLKHPTDFLTMTGTNANDYLGDNGEFLQDEFQQKLGELYRARPELFDEKPRGPVIPNIGDKPRSVITPEFQDAFKPEIHK